MRDYKIACIAGELKDAEIVLKPTDRIIVGRDPVNANLVFRDVTISRRHCLIELDKEGNYFVTDYSEAGVTSETGRIFGKGQRTAVTNGIVLNIGNAGTKIRLE